MRHRQESKYLQISATKGTKYILRIYTKAAEENRTSAENAKQTESVNLPLYVIYISLDIFRRMKHNNLTELEAWLYFLGSDDPADILCIVRKYPIFRELYQDIVNFRFQPKELISMYLDALRIMDQNMVKYMIDELKAELSMQKATYSAKLSQKDSELLQKDSELSAQISELSQKDSEIERLRAQLAKYEAQQQN